MSAVENTLARIAKLLNTIKSWEGIQVKFFTVDPNIEKILKCFLTKFELFTSSRFQDIAVQN